MFRRSDGMGYGDYLHIADMPLLCEEVYGEAYGNDVVINFNLILIFLIF